MKAKKIVYLMLIMVVLISGCNHQNNNMEESKKHRFQMRKHQILRRNHLPLSLLLFRQRQFPPLYLQRIITRKRMHLLDMQKQITLRKKLRILYITKMVKAYNSAGYRGGKTNYSYGKTALCQYRRTCFAEE